MKKAILVRFDDKGELKIVVSGEKYIPGINLCKCCYVKVRNKSKKYSDVFNFALDLKHEENENTEKSLSEVDLDFLFGSDCDYDIWILKELVDKTFYSREGKEPFTLTNNDVKTVEEFRQKQIIKSSKGKLKNIPGIDKTGLVQNRWSKRNIKHSDRNKTKVLTTDEFTNKIDKCETIEELMELISTTEIDRTISGMNLSEMLKTGEDFFEKIMGFKLHKEPKPKTGNEDINKMVMDIFGINNPMDILTLENKEIDNIFLKIVSSEDGVKKILDLANLVKTKLENKEFVNKDDVWSKTMKKKTDDLIESLSKKSDDLKETKVEDPKDVMFKQLCKTLGVDYDKYKEFESIMSGILGFGNKVANIKNSVKNSKLLRLYGKIQIENLTRLFERTAVIDYKDNNLILISNEDFQPESELEQLDYFDVFGIKVTVGNYIILPNYGKGLDAFKNIKISKRAVDQIMKEFDITLDQFQEEIMSFKLSSSNSSRVYSEIPEHVYRGKGNLSYYITEPVIMDVNNEGNLIFILDSDFIVTKNDQMINIFAVKQYGKNIDKYLQIPNHFKGKLQNLHITERALEKIIKDFNLTIKEFKDEVFNLKPSVSTKYYNEKLMEKTSEISDEIKDKKSPSFELTPFTEMLCKMFGGDPEKYKEFKKILEADSVPGLGEHKHIGIGEEELSKVDLKPFTGKPRGGARCVMSQQQPSILHSGTVKSDDMTFILKSEVSPQRVSMSDHKIGYIKLFGSNIGFSTVGGKEKYYVLSNSNKKEKIDMVNDLFKNIAGNNYIPGINFLITKLAMVNLIKNYPEYKNVKFEEYKTFHELYTKTGYELETKDKVLLTTKENNIYNAISLEENDLFYNDKIQEDIYKFDMKINKDAKALISHFKTYILGNKDFKLYFTKNILDAINGDKTMKKILFDNSDFDIFKNLKFKKLNRKSEKELENLKPSNKPVNGLGVNFQDVLINITSDGKLEVIKEFDKKDVYQILHTNRIHALVKFFRYLEFNTNCINVKMYFTEDAVKHFNQSEEFNNIGFGKVIS